MQILEYFFTLLLGIQLIHSIEELSTGFNEKFPLFKMKFKTFLAFEIFFITFWSAIFLFKEFVYRDQFMAFFVLLMFANGLWHIVWWGVVKKYVPGLVTAPLFLIVFIIFYFKALF